MENKCEVCGIEFESKKPAKTCSPRCRVTLARKRVTRGANVTLDEPNVTRDVTFEFYTETIPRTTKSGKVPGEKSAIRTAKYWYDVPLSAIPVIKKGWPAVPIFEIKDGLEPMNGRQYFLWWKNNFEVGKGKSPFDGPILHNPFKT